MKEIMFKFYKLLLLVLVSCSVSVFAMEEDGIECCRRIVEQTPLLPGEPIRQTGAVETVIRDALCGGFIKPSVMGAIMAVALANHHDGPCKELLCRGDVSLRCFWQVYVGCSCMVLACVFLKGLGFLYDVANNYPTERAVFWRDGCRVLYGVTTACAILYSDYLFKKLV